MEPTASSKAGGSSHQSQSRAAHHPLPLAMCALLVLCLSDLLHRRGQGVSRAQAVILYGRSALASAHPFAASARLQQLS